MFGEVGEQKQGGELKEIVGLFGDPSEVLARTVDTYLLRRGEKNDEGKRGVKKKEIKEKRNETRVCCNYMF